MTYAMKVEQGKEATKAKELVRQGIRASVLPKLFNALSPKDKRKSPLLLPGFILLEDPPEEMIRKEQLIRIPEAELRRMMRMSDTTPSEATYDGQKITFTSGPMMGAEPFVSKVDEAHQNVLVKIKLLGEIRNIWLACRIQHIQAPAAAAQKRLSAYGPVLQDYKSQGSVYFPEGSIRPAPAYQRAPQSGRERRNLLNEDNPSSLEEQKAAAVARAEEIGVKKAAEELGMTWQLLAQWKKQAAKEALSGETEQGFRTE